MKHIIIPTFVLLLAAGAAHAGPTQYDKQIREPIATVDGGRYWALFGGVNANQSADINDSSNRLGKFRNELDSDTGYFGGVKLGYEYPSTGWAAMALEVEALYTRLDAEASSKSGGFQLQSSGEISAAVFMANALVKFRPIGPVRPYVGGGVGVAHLWLKNTDSVVTFRGTRTGTLPRDDAKDWTLAYQGIGGLDWQVTDRWSLFAEYKALVFHDAVGIDRFLNHLVGIGVRVGF